MLPHEVSILSLQKGLSLHHHFGFKGGECGLGTLKVPLVVDLLFVLFLDGLLDVLNLCLSMLLTVHFHGLAFLFSVSLVPDLHIVSLLVFLDLESFLLALKYECIEVDDLIVVQVTDVVHHVDHFLLANFLDSSDQERVENLHGS